MFRRKSKPIDPALLRWYEAIRQQREVAQRLHRQYKGLLKAKPETVDQYRALRAAKARWKREDDHLWRIVADGPGI